jgi:predicted porin
MLGINQFEESSLMNKKVMAIAVAGVLTAPAAFAQSSNVQLYGRANLGFDFYEASGARSQGAGPGLVNGSAIDYDGRFRVFDNSSRVGLRGTEDLGNGLKAIFQIETGVNIDSGGTTGQGGQANASSGTWASRDSFVGLDSGFGRLTFGRQSIYWANGELAQFAANYINTEIPWTNGTQLGRISRGPGAPAVVARTPNTVQYTTPTFAGFNGTLSYSPNAQESVQHTTSVEADGAIWGATLRGRFGNFHGQFDYVSVDGNTPITAGPGNPLGQAPGAVRVEYDGYKAGIGWKYMPGANVSFIWVRTETNNALGVRQGDDVNQNGYTVNWEHTFGNIQALAQYGWLDEMKGCDGTETVPCTGTKAQAFMVGARYLLSKRTWLYASYNKINNKENQFADFTGAAITSVGGFSTTPYDADPEIWALGVFHAF